MNELQQQQLSIVTQQRNSALDTVAVLAAQIEMAKKVLSANAEKIAALEKQLAETKAPTEPQQAPRPRVVAGMSSSTTMGAPTTSASTFSGDESA